MFRQLAGRVAANLGLNLWPVELHSIRALLSQSLSNNARVGQASAGMPSRICSACTAARVFDPRITAGPWRILAKNWPVRSDKGHAGGWRLARDAALVSVAVVVRALGETMIPQPAQFGPSHCAIERALHGAVDAALAEAEVLVMSRLAGSSIAALAGAMLPEPGLMPWDRAIGGDT